jgi:hypothetical protein
MEENKRFLEPYPLPVGMLWGVRWAHYHANIVPVELRGKWQKESECQEAIKIWEEGLGKLPQVKRFHLRKEAIAQREKT